MNSQVKRTPNPEQTKAIFHSGGKLLSAGAGSGKTFVLVEHIIFQLENFRDQTPKHEWSLKLGGFLRRKVLMTFTKKAAGEMTIRIFKKIDEMLEESIADVQKREHDFWVLVKENINHLNILTIHGFCHKILRHGYWSHLPKDVELLTALEHKNKITKLFDRWYSINSPKTNPLLLANVDSILESMMQVFSSPELRFMWSNRDQISSLDDVLDQYFTHYLSHSPVRELFKNSEELFAMGNHKNKKWQDLATSFYSLTIEIGPLSANNFESYCHFFNQIPRFPALGKDASEKDLYLIELLKELRGELSKTIDDFLNLKLHFQIYQEWSKTLSEVFCYIDAHYLEIEGFTFSDLEYYVLKGLEDELVCKKIQESFDYFIVDEFQDTSSIQYEILNKLIGSNSQKMFAVGDKKQAIYGFRGGELSVFEMCSKQFGVENNYKLRQNYRSSSQVIHYNNSLFEIVFPLASGFEGVDPHTIKMEHQEVPQGVNPRGDVVALTVHLNEEQTDSLVLDEVESKIIATKIKTLLNDQEIDSICVLYRKLMPSKFLLEELQSENIAYSAQVKIQIEEDPVANLFLLLVELLLNKDNLKKSNSSKFLMMNLIKLIGRQVDDIDSHIQQFFDNYNLYGIKNSYHILLLSLGLTNSFHNLNTSIIDMICEVTSENLVMIYELLKRESASDYSFDMMKGNHNGSKKRIIIMTAHASKGLEFDAVFLAGIHSNGRQMGMKELIGKLPGSFKWKANIGQKKFFKTPFYFFESELRSQKEFSESKRLLYVACTRAIKRLIYVDISGVVKHEISALFENKNSWIQALRLYKPPSIEAVTLDDNFVSRKDLALLHKDSIGLNLSLNLPRMGLTSELSVTRLASIAQCPFKFYLQNICRLDPQEKFYVDEESEDDFFSSMERGTRMHSVLADLFQNKISINQVLGADRESISWAYELARANLNHFEIISEKMIKFSFFGQMISGTPDLVFLDGNWRLIIWDFKTGLRGSEKEEAYWFQLMCYAYAYGKMKHFSQESRIEYSLIYLDEKKEIKREATLEQITQELFLVWCKLQSLQKISPQHCPYCNFNQICQRRQFPT